MTKENPVQITTPNGTVVSLPEMDEGVSQYIVNLYKRVDPEFSKTEFGHAAMSLATTSVAMAEFESNPEKQKMDLRRRAIDVIKKFGPNIIPLLRDELKLSLTDEDIQVATSKK